MDFLPEEIINEILLVVDRPTIYNASLVCKQWRFLSLKQVKIIKNLHDFKAICKQCDRLSIINANVNKSWLNPGLNSGCRGGSKDIVELMIANGAKHWNWGLYYSCQGGYKELAELMIAKGPDDWDGGLVGACQQGCKELAELMIAKGADRCECQKSIRQH